ncbi:MAG: glycosyl hydrolase family 28-related protein, partial [Bacteroidota bacterium]|nr:glycosyl hydrolase family 28-related protein [Bacteroidota bacterium]
MKTIRIIPLISMFSLCLLGTNFQEGRAQSAYVAPVLPSVPDKVFNIKDYGAVADNSTDNTKAIQAAIDAAANAGGGRVVVPAGEYLCGPIQFTSNFNLQIESGAILRMLPLERYPGGLTEGQNFINGIKLHDVAITGSGIIDGQGSPWW